VVQRGFLVEETILEEAADAVVIGHRQAGRWRRMIRRLTDDPDIEHYLREKLDCGILVVN